MGLDLNAISHPERNRQKLFQITGMPFPHPGDETMETINPEERDVVNIINEYSERNLFKLFSRDKSVKEFLGNIAPEKLEKFIRPFIERRLYKCFTIARDENIPVYYQRTKSDALHPEDLLHLGEDNAEPVFIFIRDEEQSTYNLSLEAGGKLIDHEKKLNRYPLHVSMYDKRGSQDFICFGC